MAVTVLCIVLLGFLASSVIDAQLAGFSAFCQSATPYTCTGTTCSGSAIPGGLATRGFRAACIGFCGTGNKDGSYQLTLTEYQNIWNYCASIGSPTGVCNEATFASLLAAQQLCPIQYLNLYNFLCTLAPVAGSTTTLTLADIEAYFNAISGGNATANAQEHCNYWNTIYSTYLIQLTNPSCLEVV